jgi:tRNA pseudouridine38-40 synthase
MRNLKLVLEYDGTEFHGFQRQTRLRTVQGALEEACSRLLREPIKVIGAGRTDAGVHARGQVVNFSTTRPLPSEKLAGVLNRALPADVKVQQVEEVEADFHARRSARRRTYEYTIVERELPSPILGRYALVVLERLDLVKMAQAAAPLVGRHDFRAFQGGGAETASTERTLFRLACRREDDNRIILTAEADAFLYQMVRLMVGTLLKVGRGQMTPPQVAALLATQDRRRVPAPAPACGLCLVQVSYPPAG